MDVDGSELLPDVGWEFLLTYIGAWVHAADQSEVGVDVDGFTITML
jgi:hypothetical protein